MCVVNDAHHRQLLGCLGEYRQGRDRHQERLDRPHLLPERDPERARLWFRQPPDEIEDGSEQPVKRRERQRRLGLQTLGAQHPHVAHRGQDLRQESRLPNARFPMHHHAAGRPAAGVLNQCDQTRHLDVSTMQHVVTVPRHRHAGVALSGPPAIPAL